MNRRYRSLWLLTLMLPAAALLARCGNDAPTHPIARSEKQRITSPQVSAADLQSVVEGNNRFALELYQHAGNPAGNQFLAPASVSTALAMLHGGARGATEKDLAKVLHFALPEERLHAAFNKLDLELSSRGQGKKAADGGAFRLKLANALWAERSWTFLASYLDLIAVNYGAGIHLVDFGNRAEDARATINQWVENETEDRIKDLLPKGSVDSSTKLVLTNAVYFNAAWAKPFVEGLTAPQPFQAAGSTVQAQMMSQTIEAPHAKGEGFQAIELPYDGGELSCLVLVPDAGSFASFSAGLTVEKLATIRSALSKTTVDLKLPRFEMTASYGLKDTLRAMGLENTTDLSGIDGSGMLELGNVLHKAFVRVDEKGSEAAGATAVIVDGGSAMPLEPPLSLVVDRPFLFLIRDGATGAILFVGHVVDPTA